MAIQQYYSEQFHTKLSKGTSKTLYQALRYTCLSYSLHLRWQELTNKRRLYLRGNWSNLQKAQDLLSIINEVSTTQVNQLALDNLLEELEEAKNEAPMHLQEDLQGYKLSFTPEEYQLQKECFQFVLDQFQFDYHWLQIPHEFKYQPGCKVRCWYKSVPYASTEDNGRHWYQMLIDPTGSYHNGRWYTYGRSSLGWKAKGIKVADEYPEFLHKVYLIHEITHAVENYRSHRTKKKYTSSEMNTTLHELWYVREHYPAIFRKLSPVQDGRRNSWWSPVPPLEGQTVPTDARQAAAPKGNG